VQAGLEGSRLVFLDETGSNVAMTRRRARSRRGRPVAGSVPLNRGSNLTVVGAIRSGGGLVAWRAMDGAMTGARFLRFVVEALIPALSEGDVLVLGNLSAHKTRAVREALAEAGVGVLYLPRYSPEYNPIELCWAFVKARLRSVGARTREALRVAVEVALSAVGSEQVRRWIRHCGYRLAIT
jgi:transposase